MEIINDQPRCHVTKDSEGIYWKNGYRLLLSRTGRFSYKTETGCYPMRICKEEDCWSNTAEGYQGYCRSHGLMRVGPHPYVEARIAYNKTQ